MKLLVSAHEYSANIHLKSLLQYLPKETELLGIFDKTLGTPIADVQSAAVMGYVDAFKKLRYFLKLADEMVTLAKQADKVLLIDASGFNLPLAKKLKKRYPKKEVIYYILPQVWIWKKRRIKILEKNIDHLVSILPFEKKLYSEHAHITYAGHPLLDTLQICKKDIDTEIKMVTFMPGSRRSEIKKLMPAFRRVAAKINADCTIVIPKHFHQEEIKELYGNLSSFTIAHDTHKALQQADFAFICAGTATLEASLIGTPFVLVYKFAMLDYLLYRLLVKIKYIGLGNILLKEHRGKVLHPELIQSKVTADNLIETMRSMDRDVFYQDSLSILEYLDHGSAKNVAAIIKE